MCKIAGCETPAKSAKGRYGGLCEDHIEERRAVGSALVAPPDPDPDPGPEVSRPEPATTPSPASEGFEARAQRLVEAGRSLDEARLALDAATRVHDAAVTAWEDAQMWLTGNERVAEES